MPSSSIHTPFGTFTIPSSSSSRCASSISDGCVGLGAVDPRAGRLRAADVERDRHDLEALRLKLAAQFLPHGQVEAAASPRRPGDQQHLRAAQRAQRERAAVAVGELEVGQLGAEQRAPAGLGPERPEAVLARRATSAMPSRSASTRASSARRRAPAAARSGRALQAPSGLSSQPVRALELIRRDRGAVEDHGAILRGCLRTWSVRLASAGRMLGARMSKENVEVVRATFDAYLRGDDEGLVGFAHPDVEIQPSSDSTESTPQRGHDAFLRFFHEWESAWENYSSSRANSMTRATRS